MVWSVKGEWRVNEMVENEIDRRSLIIEKFEKNWKKEISKSDYIQIELKNGVIIIADKYELLGTDILVWIRDIWIALVPLKTIKKIESKLWKYVKIN